MGNISDTEENDVRQVSDGDDEFSDMFSDKHNGTQSSGFISIQNHTSFNNTILVNFIIRCQQYYLNFVCSRLRRLPQHLSGSIRSI